MKTKRLGSIEGFRLNGEKKFYERSRVTFIFNRDLLLVKFEVKMKLGGKRRQNGDDEGI